MNRSCKHSEHYKCCHLLSSGIETPALCLSRTMEMKSPFSLAPINSVQSQMSPVESSHKLQNGCNNIIARINAYVYQRTEKWSVFLIHEYFCAFNFLKRRENGSRIACMNAIKQVEEGKVLIHRFQLHMWKKAVARPRNRRLYSIVYNYGRIQAVADILIPFTNTNLLPVPVAARSRSLAARLLRLRVRIPLGAWMFVVSVVCCQVED